MYPFVLLTVEFKTLTVPLTGCLCTKTLCSTGLMIRKNEQGMGEVLRLARYELALLTPWQVSIRVLSYSNCQAIHFTPADGPMAFKQYLFWDNWETIQVFYKSRLLSLALKYKLTSEKNEYHKYWGWNWTHMTLIGGHASPYYITAILPCWWPIGTSVTRKL